MWHYTCDIHFNIRIQFSQFSSIHLLSNEKCCLLFFVFTTLSDGRNRSDLSNNYVLDVTYGQYI